ncbi:class I SAM-dependent methyltransferase [Lysobacter silvisoli]|uniref:Class I SAM-dependent methyltransferase n=2 Tax=Lysobacter silvisoli TaxID=2293254 RepID=A0A371K3S7_9GAMM|nr:class I SAM-dependent methyltransferase [Lysobacter silvisoli]
MDHFHQAAQVTGYAQKAARMVPGLADLHLMSLLLLSERAPDDAKMLVVGAGGGLELKCFAQARPDWSFAAVDPSRPMLDLAVQALGPLGSRVDWIEGYVDDVPGAPFDGASCFLVLHFLPRPERLALLKAVRARLRRGAALVVAHHCLPSDDEDTLWLARSVAFGAGPQADFAQAAASGAGMARKLALLTAQEEEALLEEAGFGDVAMFYAGFSFRGWVAVAGG